MNKEPSWWHMLWIIPSVIIAETAAGKAYKKANGVWAEQTDLTTVFDAGKSWVKG